MYYVVLTRDAAKDAPLARRLDAVQIPHRSVPLLKHAPGPDHDELPGRLRERWDWVVVTSPTAAAFLLKAWEQAGNPGLRVAAIGKGTARALEAGGLPVSYTSPQAYGSYLAADLGGAGRVLWPTSALAGQGLQKTLDKRGFRVIRLDVYLTLPRSLSEEELEVLRGARVAALASPSAVRAWVEATPARPAVAAIGRVSAEAALRAGFGKVWFPDNPGIEGWAQIIADVFRRETRRA
ncbi:uroporphyrinogen-III synthase [Oceanithermus sp.]